MKIIKAILGSCLVANALSDLRPGALWSIRGDDYGTLVWMDTVQSQPTRGEITQAIADCRTEETASRTQKPQAVLDAKNVLLTPQARLDALIKAIDLK